MRLDHSLLLSALSCAVSVAAAASDSAHVYIRHASRSRREVNEERRRLSPSAARMVLAQRAGVEEYHSTENLDAHALHAINDFGSTSNLFGDGDNRRQAIVLLHTDDDISSKLSPSDDVSHFHISPLPSLDSTRSLLHDIALQAKVDSSAPHGNLVISTTHTSQSFRAEDYPGYDLLIITLPTTTTAHNTWGPYTPPRANNQKRDRTEQPLATPSATTTSTPSPSQLKGIYPTCFPSLSTCQSLTRNCSSHGACGLKYTDPSANDGSPHKHCYACACSPQEDGQGSTTYWGGPACQKKDVSVEFWMIALFSVAMVGLISFAVGTVWSMGDEELPSVIGSGVSGPVARR